MNNYKNESTFWLIEHANDVALEISHDNADAIVAIAALLSEIKGAQAFKEMRIELTPEEWAKLYRVCEEDTGKLISSIIVINCLSDASLARANLRLKIPAQFVTQTIHNSPSDMFGGSKWLFEKKLREDFIARYRLAKVSQPKPDRYLI